MFSSPLGKNGNKNNLMGRIPSYLDTLIPGPWVTEEARMPVGGCTPPPWPPRPGCSSGWLSGKEEAYEIITWAHLSRHGDLVWLE